jgi:hypothetical protein
MMTSRDFRLLKSVAEQWTLLAHLIEFHLRKLFPHLRFIQHRLCFVEPPERELQDQGADNTKADNAERHTVPSRV